MGPSFILVANPGSASRKYAVYDDKLDERGKLHFEHTDGAIVCTVIKGKSAVDAPIEITKLQESAKFVEPLLKEHGILHETEKIDAIGLRVVAPSAFFMEHHLFTDEIVKKLEETREMAPLHIGATLDELGFLREHFGKTPIVGVSDSAFHANKPNYSWNYGINIEDANKYDIKRFGYHGLSVSATVDTLRDMDRLPPRVVVCHLGSGSSVSAVLNGRSIDNTMGYSPLEGLIMSTRSGTIDFNVAVTLKRVLGLNDAQLQVYLNNECGLLGLGGSNDIRELREREENGDHLAHLALETLVHTVQKAIGGMIAALGGVDMIVFTGTVGERSFMLRKRIISKLTFLDFELDGDINVATSSPRIPTLISELGPSKPIFVIPTNENHEIARFTKDTLKKAR